MWIMLQWWKRKNSFWFLHHLQTDKICRAWSELFHFTSAICWKLQFSRQIIFSGWTNVNFWVTPRILGYTHNLTILSRCKQKMHMQRLAPPRHTLILCIFICILDRHVTEWPGRDPQTGRSELLLMPSAKVQLPNLSIRQLETGRCISVEHLECIWSRNVLKYLSLKVYFCEFSCQAGFCPHICGILFLSWHTVDFMLFYLFIFSNLCRAVIPIQHFPKREPRLIFAIFLEEPVEREMLRVSLNPQGPSWARIIILYSTEAQGNKLYSNNQLQYPTKGTMLSTPP